MDSTVGCDNGQFKNSSKATKRNLSNVTDCYKTSTKVVDFCTKDANKYIGANSQDVSFDLSQKGYALPTTEYSSSGHLDEIRMRLRY